MSLKSNKGFQKGYEGCDNAWDLGWKHGTEDIHNSFKYRPYAGMSQSDYEDYKDGYKEARKGWD